MISLWYNSQTWHWLTWHVFLTCLCRTHYGIHSVMTHGCVRTTWEVNLLIIYWSKKCFKYKLLKRWNTSFEPNIMFPISLLVFEIIKDFWFWSTLYWKPLLMHSVHFTLFIREHYKLALTNWKSRGNNKANLLDLLCYACICDVLIYSLKWQVACCCKSNAWLREKLIIPYMFNTKYTTQKCILHFRCLLII